MFKAAELGDPKAKYQVGAILDLGDYGIEQDKEKASYIFKELAELGDPHCMWIYACELIWGNGTFPQSTEEGIEILEAAVEQGSSSACITLATFYNDGRFGYPKDIQERDRLRKLAFEYDEATFDPYA